MKVIAIALVGMALACWECQAQIEENVIVLYSVGGTAGEFYGDSVDVAGDLDGDGVNDLLVGAPFGNAGGRATALSGRTGALLFEMRAAGAGQQFGWEVAGLGDMNGDDVPDILVGAPAANGRGEASVFSGVSGTLIRTFAGEHAGDRFSERIARLPDLDGDRTNDLLIAAPSANGAGTVYLYSGRDGNLIASWSGEHPDDHFGSAVSALADLDGDGAPDFVIGAYGAGPYRNGRLYLYSGRTRERMRTIDGEERGTTFGRHYVGGFSDADGDGLPDLVTADIGHGIRGPNTGRAYVISSRTGQFLRTYSGTQNTQYFGTGTKQIADVDGDQWPDLFVGAAFDNTGGLETGRAFVYSGREDGTILGVFTSVPAGATLGARGIDAGDLDGDGLHELLLTAPTDPANGLRAGRIYLISGASFTPAPAPKLRFAMADGGPVVRGGLIPLTVENFAFRCEGTAPVPRLRVEVDGQLDHRSCTGLLSLQKTYPLGLRTLVVTLEDAKGAPLASATLTVNLIQPKRRRAV